MAKTVAELTNSELINWAVDNSLEEETYYAALATPLKSAEILKKEHKQQALEAFQLKGFDAAMRRGLTLILERLPHELSPAEAQLFLDDLAHIKAPQSDAYLKAQYEKLKELPSTPETSFQSIFALSDNTMEHIYALGLELLNERAYADAETVFSVATYLNPFIPENLIGSGIALFWQKKYQNALQWFEIAQELQPDKAVALVYAALCKLNLNETADLKGHLQSLEKIFKSFPDEKKQWGDFYISLKAF